MTLNSKVANNIVFEILTIIILIMAFSIVAMSLNTPFKEINTQIQGMPDSEMSPEAKNISLKSSESYPSFMDSLILTMLVLFWIVVLVSAFYIDSHPAFFVISLILLIIVLFVSAYIGNSMEEIGSFSDMSGDQFPLTMFIFSHLLLIVFVMGISVLLLIYAKTRS